MFILNTSRLAAHLYALARQYHLFCLSQTPRQATRYLLPTVCRSALPSLTFAERTLEPSCVLKRKRGCRTGCWLLFSPFEQPCQKRAVQTQRSDTRKSGFRLSLNKQAGDLPDTCQV
jgi:hypothetical protein